MYCPYAHLPNTLFVFVIFIVYSESFLFSSKCTFSPPLAFLRYSALHFQCMPSTSSTELIHFLLLFYVLSSIPLYPLLKQGQIVLYWRVRRTTLCPPTASLSRLKSHSKQMARFYAHKIESKNLTINSA